MNISCPKCESNATDKSRGCLVWFIVIMFFPLGLLALLKEPVKQCRNCRYTWK